MIWVSLKQGKAPPWCRRRFILQAALFLGLFGYIEGVGVALSCLTAEVRHGPGAEQRAVNPLAQFLQRYFAQPEKFAVHNGKSVK